MIYTSYYANIRKFPENLIPISIAGKAPDWYNGLEYKKLAPKYGFFQEWKKNHDNNFYIEHFNAEVLAGRSPEQTLKEIKSMVPADKDIALCCYEKPTDFCHRHLVAEWLNNNTDEYIKEWIKE